MQMISTKYHFLEKKRHIRNIKITHRMGGKAFPTTGIFGTENL
jgi:hypothetical protein